MNSAPLIHIASIRTDLILSFCCPVLAVFSLVIIVSYSSFSSLGILELIITKSNNIPARHHWKWMLPPFCFAQKLNSANSMTTIFTESQNTNYQCVLICNKVFFSFWAKQAQMTLLTSSNDSYFSLASEHKQMWTDTTEALCYNSSPFYSLIPENSVLLLFFIMLYRNSNWIWVSILESVLSLLSKASQVIEAEKLNGQEKSVPIIYKRRTKLQSS